MKQALLGLPGPHASVLSFLVKRVPPAEILWALTGSAGLRLQGVDLPVHDLDLQTDVETVFLLEKELAEFLTAPVHVWESEHTQSYHAQAVIRGLPVELLGDMRHRLPDGAWSLPVDPGSLRVWVEWQGIPIPVMPLEHEALAYERMGRVQKAGRIRSLLQREGR